MWKIYIDVSGMPQDDIFVAGILFNDQYKLKFIREFYRKFPDLKAYTKKSTRVNSDRLFEAIKFLADKRLRMVCYHFKKHQWKKHERQINELHKELNPLHKYKTNFYSFNEKLMGILYYLVITRLGMKNQNYQVTACVESCIDVWEVFKIVNKLAKKDGWNISINANIRKIEHLLKIADYVAGANRKIKEFKLETISRHDKLSDPISNFNLKRIFNIWPSKFNTTKKFINFKSSHKYSR